ncbi:Hypothetical protein CINCED_3A003402 [Cinara cedri]|uniref:Uncharacterized protein n=1 Tax=Cinara cedri TaxID=506608 RepID=A0A5E4MGJ8_9HEMI|nr:Hypothetical protein CINCED_3A003402 [Cinara cedri]
MTEEEKRGVPSQKEKFSAFNTDCRAVSANASNNGDDETADNCPSIILLIIVIGRSAVRSCRAGLLNTAGVPNARTSRSAVESRAPSSSPRIFEVFARPHRTLEHTTGPRTPAHDARFTSGSGGGGIRETTGRGPGATDTAERRPGIPSRSARNTRGRREHVDDAIARTTVSFQRGGGQHAGERRARVCFPDVCAPSNRGLFVQTTSAAAAAAPVHRRPRDRWDAELCVASCTYTKCILSALYKLSGIPSVYVTGCHTDVVTMTSRPRIIRGSSIVQ